MNITVITGSPHKRGTSAYLADHFIQGAEERGHTVYRFDTAFEELHPCLGCDQCGRTGRCVYQDSMEKLIPHLLEADVVTFATPLYYFGMSAQLKMVIDRFYAINYKLMGSGKKAVLLATAYDNNDWTMRELTAHYRTIVKYLNWTDAGMVLAGGCGNRSDIERSDFGQQAYHLGKNL